MLRNKKFLHGVSAVSALALLMISSCHEVGPAIDLTETEYITFVETPETPQDKIVLMEDFTGAACPNCPTAHEALANTIAAHPGRIAAVAEYNYFADPLYPDQNFVTLSSMNINNYLGPVLAWPAGFVDRTEIGGTLNQTPGNYLSAAESELSKTPPCNVYITPVFDAISRNLHLEVTVKYTEDITMTNHLSIMLVENGIIAAQIDDAVGGEVPDYTHNHVLRTMLTFYNGTDLPEENIAGRGYTFTYDYTIPDNWNADNMEAIAFVHNFETDNKEVLQAAIVSVE